MPAGMYVLRVCLMTRATREGMGLPETRVTDVFELLCLHWKPNPDSLQEQPGLLIAEPALQNKPETEIRSRFDFS